MDDYKQRVEENIKDLKAIIERDTETLRLQQVILDKLNKRK